MTYLTQLLLSLTLLLSITIVNAQNNKLEKANKKFEQYAFIDAQKIYLKLAQDGYESAEMYKKLGDSYYFNGLYAESAKWYGMLFEKFNDEATPEYYFRYAQSLKANKDYEQADVVMSKFQKISGNDSRAELLEETPDYLSQISYMESDYEVENMRKLNSKYSDFGPALYEDKLIFSSTRDTGIFSRKKHKWNNQPFLDFYAVTLDDETGDYSPVSKFGGLLNTPFHESTPVFTRDGQTVYFARNNYSNGSKKKDKNGTTRLKLYKAIKQGSSWTQGEELPFNSDDYSITHPALSPDEKTLYFASDMPGSLGFSDIWKIAINSDGSYGEPVNLGPKINTEGRENFPFMSTDDNLYFSSDGRPGLGGLDIFVAAKNQKGDVVQIVNLGEPINSAHDDFAFIVDEATQMGYFSTNRYFGMGSDDIFRFTKEAIKPPECHTVIVGTIKDSETLEPIPTATVTSLDMDGKALDKTVAKADGSYIINPLCDEELLLRAEEPYYYASEKIVHTPKLGDTTVVDFLLEPRIKRVKEGDDLAKLLGLKPIYFDFDRFNIRPDAAIELTKVVSVMEENPNMVVKIRSHTDSRGNDAYNLSLSDKRARATADYIVSRGIERSRISGEGFGETELLNDCGNGADCSDEEHQLNRRSEFIVISF